MEFFDRALELKKNNAEITYPEIVDILLNEGYNVNVVQIKKRFSRYKNKKQNIVYEDKKPIPESEDVLDYYQKLKALNKSIDNLDTKQTKTTITIQDNRPIGIAFLGDIHTGAKNVNYQQFDIDRELIKNTDGLYTIGMGDYKENQSALVHGTAVNEQTATPSMQDLLVIEFIKELKEKLIALIRGCHDDWDYRLGNKDFIAYLSEIADCVNLWHGGTLNIKLGSEEYIIRARHKYKGSSDLNTTNSQRRMLDFFGASDVIALAHLHYPDLQMLYRMGQKVVYIRSGSYKGYDEFGQKIAGYKGEIGVPIVVLYPDTHKVVPFQNLEDGITFLNAVRTGKILEEK